VSLTPKRIILSLLSAAPGGVGTSAHIVRAAETLGVAPNAVRVALARLKGAGLVSAMDRGTYRLGDEARAVHAQVARWRSRGEQVGAWGGGYIAIHLGGLAKSDRTALRRRSRAMRLMGFAEAAPALAIRPENLTEPLSATRTRLLALGLEPDAIVYAASQLPRRVIAQAVAQWDPESLNAGYQRLTAALETTGKALDVMPLAEAARRAFLLGDEAIRAIVVDPLLPAPTVDVAARRRLTEAMRRFDVLGRTLWARVFQAATQPRRVA